MKKNNDRLSWCLSILLASAMAATFWQTPGRTEEHPAGETSGEHQSPATKPEGMSERFRGTVVEMIDAGRHIYVRIDTGKQRVWVAVPSFDGKPGDEVVVPPGVPVADFKSKKLNRTFKIIYFVGAVRRVDESRPE